MPIYKYRSFEEAEKHLQQLLPADPLIRLLRLQEIVAPLNPPCKIARGIFRFRTLAEANEHRKAIFAGGNTVGAEAK
jgi:hypothetical protein